MILDQLATTTVPFLRLVVQKGMVFDVNQNSFKRWEVKRNEMLVTCYCIILSVMKNMVHMVLTSKQVPCQVNITLGFDGLVSWIHSKQKSEKY